MFLRCDACLGHRYPVGDSVENTSKIARLGLVCQECGKAGCWSSAGQVLTDSQSWLGILEVTS